jgi:hypothetical protein
MTVQAKTEAIRVLEKAQAGLMALARTAESEIGMVSRSFAGLAAHTDTILHLAGAMVGCTESESMHSVMPKVQSLGTEARRFVADRVQATAAILETVAKQVKLLGQLSLVTRDQATVTRETKVLSVLTNIEVARLGTLGAGFQYLARQLADFSKSVAEDTQELLVQTEERRAATEGTRHLLADELPRLRVELGRIETDLGNALSGVDSSLNQLCDIPRQFESCVQDLAQQIAGVVAAVQAHDITHQQIHHVHDAFTLICGILRGAGESGQEESDELARGYAGITIQIYQLRTIKDTVASWATQIRTCLEGILRVSTSQVGGIGPMVLEQGRQVSSQLAHIELLEQKSQSCSERIQSTLGALSSLMELVGGHLQRSKSVQERLQLLTFNSIIEANRLGKQASAIMAIAKSIEGISVKWALVTGQSRQVMEEIAGLVKQTNQVMEVFSEASNQRLREAQAQTGEGLQKLQSTAGLADSKAQEMNFATETLQARVARIGSSSDVLDTCFGRLDAWLGELEAVRHQFEVACPNITKGYDRANVEQLFSAGYTTEMERDVLQAALNGTALPMANQSFAGNSVELF